MLLGELMVLLTGSRSSRDKRRILFVSRRYLGDARAPGRVQEILGCAVRRAPPSDGSYTTRETFAFAIVNRRWVRPGKQEPGEVARKPHDARERTGRPDRSASQQSAGLPRATLSRG